MIDTELMMDYEYDFQLTNVEAALFPHVHFASLDDLLGRQASPELPYTLRTDTSAYAIGAALLQGEGPNEQPIEYAPGKANVLADIIVRLL